MASEWSPKKGDRVTWRGLSGVVDDDYWAYRDRYTVRFDDGSESDFSAESLRLVPPAPGAV